ncbi:unnamed protein product [Rhizoctonia solani]|uniref:F-box domain-containing protein n=1 Tax=Rhizoctonia solani TaxID=456999 RepID=A0A8H3A6C0_9AGAM|nr:unnamed protein product [Rhizoctonia solani]
MLDELRVASDLLRLALYRYRNACLAIKRCSTEYYPFAGQPQSTCPTSHMVLDEASLLEEHETKLRKSRITLHQIVNLYPDVVPVSRLPIDILVRIFTRLTEEEYEHALSDNRKATINMYPMTLSHVCSHWRQIVLQSPSLWSYITLVPDTKNKQRLAYVDFHSRRSKEALVDLFIAIRASKISNSTISINPFIGRIRSLRLRFRQVERNLLFSYVKRFQRTMHWKWVNLRVTMQAGHLITRCLRASNHALRQFVLHMGAVTEQHPFVESVAHPANRNSLRLDLPHDQLEDILSTITSLWLQGHYFNWESKAYHRLTTLQLEAAGQQTDLQSIPELRLANILASSPQLQYLNIQIGNIRDAIPPPPVHLSELEVLIGHVLLLQLIWPGSKELIVIIILQPDHNSSMLYSARIREFFSRANTVRLLSYGWLSSISEICHLLALAPDVRALALFFTELSGTLPDMLTYPSLNALYVLGWNIKKFVFWGRNRIVRGSSYVIDSKQSLEKELSDLKNTRLEFFPRLNEEASPIDFFASQP